MTDLRIAITKPQAGVLDTGLYASESLRAALDAGVSWTPRWLTVPDTDAARKAIGFFVGYKADIARDGIADGVYAFGPELGEANATLGLERRLRAAGIDTG